MERDFGSVSADSGASCRIRNGIYGHGFRILGIRGIALGFDRTAPDLKGCGEVSQDFAGSEGSARGV